MSIQSWLVPLLRCPQTGEQLTEQGGKLVAPSGNHFAIADGIPQFAEQFCSEAARAQQAHYEKIAQIYVKNLAYPHVQTYNGYLDGVLFDAISTEALGVSGEICCGAGEAFSLLGNRMDHGVGVDISVSMLNAAKAANPDPKFGFVQGDATMLPLADASLDNVFMLGGIHHVVDRVALFSEIERVLKPGGKFYFREPVSDFWLWRMLRAIIYRLSPALDHETERPLLYSETEPCLTQVGLKLTHWRTAGFFGFCLFMNSDVLVFNRLLRFLPGIRAITRLGIWIDELTLRLPGLSRAGVQVIGVAQKPEAFEN